jgi:hypothetical protein
MGSTPNADSFDQGPHRFAVGRDLVLDARRHLGELCTGNEPFLLQGPERVCQYFVRDIRHEPLQFIEPPRARVQPVQTNHVPLSANRVERRGERTARRGLRIRWLRGRCGIHSVSRLPKSALLSGGGAHASIAALGGL